MLELTNRIGSRVCNAMVCNAMVCNAMVCNAMVCNEINNTKKAKCYVSNHHSAC